MKLQSRKQIKAPFNHNIKPALLMALKKQERARGRLEEQQPKIMKANKSTHDLDPRGEIEIPQVQVF